MKIFEVTDFYYPWIAGPAPFIRNLSTGLARRGHDVTIVCPSPTGRRYEEFDGVQLHRVRTVPVPFGYNLRAGLPLLDLARLIRRERPDVIHIHHPFSISVTGEFCAKLLGVPVVATNHTIPECTLFGLRGRPAYRAATFLLSAHIRAVLAMCDLVTTPTETAAVMLGSLGFRGSVSAISNGVDTDRFYPASQSLPGLTILYTGRLDDDKDMDTLVRALPAVLSQFPAKVRIGGEGTDRIRLERLVHELGIADRVTFTGYVPMDELPDVYRASSVYCISSRVELQSISTLEAMASGLPVVAVNAGALPELVHTGINGELVEPEDVPGFAHAIAKILGDPVLRTRYGQASRSIAEGHSIGAMISQYERRIEEVVMKRASDVIYGSTRG